MNEQVQKIAKLLAKEIAESKEFICMRLAEDAAAEDPELVKLSALYYEKRQELESITSEEKPDFDRMGALSNEMNDIQEQMRSLPLAKAMQDARKGFTDMMNMVNMELQQVLSPGSQSSAGSCSGNCSGCSGCH